MPPATTATTPPNANSNTPCTTPAQVSASSTPTATPTPKSSAIPVAHSPATPTPLISVSQPIRVFLILRKSMGISPADSKVVFGATTIFSPTNVATTETPMAPPPPAPPPTMSPWSSCSMTTPLLAWPAPSPPVSPQAPTSTSTPLGPMVPTKPGFTNTAANWVRSWFPPAVTTSSAIEPPNYLPSGPNPPSPSTKTEWSAPRSTPPVKTVPTATPPTIPTACQIVASTPQRI